ncbi:hypothetical protein B296_00040302 [Ensete ventricosum]|uniref:Uncharacterized protein n=1 Tax=Ensete ventricosum TaxID=4639 RepID=A0A426WZN7_ENSVE|nr:hypothetical protein B296_00040302 [Ensete ventricosum]
MRDGTRGRRRGGGGCHVEGTARHDRERRTGRVGRDVGSTVNGMRCGCGQGEDRGALSWSTNGARTASCRPKDVRSR